jgi:two-component system response regulator AtoC
MRNNTNLLIIDSLPKSLTRLRTRAEELGVTSCSTISPEVTVDELADLRPDLAILGPSLSAEVTLQCLDKLKILDLTLPVLTCSKGMDLSKEPENVAFECVSYLRPDANAEQLRSAIDLGMAQKKSCEGRPEFPVLIGQSQVVKEIRKKVQNVADKGITVLITGETGTGKELVARAIHYYSDRNSGPLVKINCGALPDELLESEVFGFDKGAFTGAHRDKPGRFETAHGGTLFIDEIGDLPFHLQAKFFQVLEDQAFSRLGGTEDTVIDARVVAATNMDLWEKVREGSFRKDLFYRLNVVHINVPPLRGREEDLPRLLHYFINKYCFEFKREILKVPDNIHNFFRAYRWPGNIRELENIVRRAIVLRDWNFIFKELSLDNVNYDKSQGAPADGNIAHWQDAKIRRHFRECDFSLKKLSKAYVSDAERRVILKTLKETEWNRKKAARLLQVSYKTLLNRIDEFGLKP